MTEKSIITDSRPVKYFEDDNAIREIDNGLQKTKRILQGIVDAWHELTDEPITIEMIADQFIVLDGGVRRPFIENITRAIQLARARKSQLFNELDTDALIKILPAAPDISGVIEAVRSLGEYLPSPGWRDRFYRNCFTIKKRQVELIPAEVEKEKRPFYSYATTESELQRLALVRAVIGDLNEIIKHYPDVRPDALTIYGLVKTTIDGKLAPSSIFVETANVPGKPSNVNFFTNSKADAEKFKVKDNFVTIPADGEDSDVAAAIANKRNSQNR